MDESHHFTIFVTIWAPQTFYDTKDYNVVLLSNNIDKRTEIALQFRRSLATVSLVSDKVQKVRMKNPDKSGSKTKFDLTMTLHRNETGSTGQRHMCMTQTLQEIEAEKKNFYTFIQTDKPIYKPGDDVRFRIIVVDRDLKPYHMNNININVTDSLNRPIKVFDDLGESYLGVFTQNFSLSGNTPLGIWKIRAVIDKMEQWETSKEFAVSKYTLPPFAAYIQLKDQHLLTNSILKLSFYAKYSFEDFVRGNAQLTITCTTNGQVVVSKTFNDIANIHTVKYKAQDDLKANTTTKLDYTAAVVFTDSESGISANKSIKFTVHADNGPKIEPNHPAKFMPGLPFGIKVSVYDWNGTLIESTPERVVIKLECRLQNGEIRTDVFDGVIRRGVAIVNALIPEDTDELTVKIQYLLVEYKKKIEKDEELERIQNGRKFVIQHSKDQFSANQDDELVEDTDDLESARNPDEDAHSPADDVREDFREVFIFEELEVDHTGVMRKEYRTLDSITSWMISSFSMNEESGLAIGPPKKLKVKNQFFTKIVLPYSIRFKEKLRIDVMVYNYVDSQETLDVTVKMLNGEKNETIKKEFRFFDTECSTTASTATTMSKTVKVPYDYAKKVSFFIQSGADRTEFAELLKIRVEASGTSRSGKNVGDSIIKKLKVEPIGVKVYDIEVKSFDLEEKDAPKIETLNKNVTNGDEYPKFIVEIAGDYMTDDMTKVNLGYKIYPTHCLEQRTSRIKGNVEHFRYLKAKNANPSTTYFSDHYQSTLEQRVGSWDYATSSGFRAYFIEAIASAMEIGALPENQEIIEKELNLLKDLQTLSGNFNNFGSIPSNRDSYFQTAYILIPFLKFRNFVNKNYDAVINKGFSYLNGITSGSSSDMESYSISAYAYALYGNHETAKSLLKQTVDHKKEIARTKHCLKTSIDADCNIIHTSYAVIAYLTMNMVQEARQFSAWIMDSYKPNKYYSYTNTYAVAAEAISKFLIANPSTAKTDFTVTLTNEMDFNKVIHVTKANQKNEVEVIYPDYTLAARMSIQGSGFCSITKIMESTIALTRSSSKFTLSVTPRAGSSTSERIVKLAAPRLQKTKVQIYYNGFNRNKQYCVDVAATKYFDVKDVQNAGVMVYDYNDKQNVAVDFYKFSNSC
ncbi:thioester-containing protein 1 allele S3-like [Chironomus tepperi]|uniref:thioester-containing protein 1 allele S3-like n=1 Tax=Chironomus tepperi TaxID=113505 RepID=UPI00391F4CE3